MAGLCPVFWTAIILPVNRTAILIAVLMCATSGNGYIGSHTVVELMAVHHDVVIIDNFCNSKASVSSWGLSKFRMEIERWA